MNKKHLILLALAANAHVHGAPNLRPRQSKPEPGKNTKKSIQKQIKPIQKKTNQRNAKPQSKKIAATAHVHGADNNESILGKRPHSDRGVDHDPTKRQKIDQNDISAVKNFTTSRVFSVPTQYLTVPEALKMGVLSKKTRTKLEGLLPEKYNNETQQWERAKVGDNLDECFARCITTVLVPSIPNAIQDLPGIIGNKPVNHIKIVMINARPNPYPRPDGWPRMVNKLFTGHNNSLTCKVVQPDNTARNWNIEDLLRNVSRVKNVIFEGKTGNEKIEITIPANVGNHIVTLGNAKTLRVDDRSVTRAQETNARFIIKGNGDDPATITANSDGALSHATLGAQLDEGYPILTRTKTKGGSELTFGYDPTTKRDDTIRANSDGSICREVFDPDSESLDYKVEVKGKSELGRCELTFGYDPTTKRDDTIRANSDGSICHKVFDLESGNMHYEVEVKGKSELGRCELTVADRIIEASSNKYGMYRNYYDIDDMLRFHMVHYTRYIAEVCGTDNTLKVDPTHDTIKASSDDTVRHKFPRLGGYTLWEGTAKGCKEIKAELSIDEERKIQLASPIKLLYAYYDESFYPGIPSQSIKTEGRSTITTAPSSKIGGTVESDGDILCKKWIGPECYCQTTHARTDAQLTFGDTDIKGTAEDLLQYTEHHKGKTIHDVCIKGGAEFDLKDNPEERKIKIEGNDVDYKNDGDSNHPHKPFSEPGGQFDILLGKKPQGKEFMEIGSLRTDAKHTTEHYC